MAGGNGSDFLNDCDPAEYFCLGPTLGSPKVLALGRLLRAGRAYESGEYADSAALFGFGGVSGSGQAFAKMYNYRPRRRHRVW